MPSLEARRYYQEAWDRLFRAARSRSTLARQLQSMAAPVVPLMLSRNIVVQFDTDLARQFLDQIDETTASINASMAELNKYASKAGLPKVHWESPTHFGSQYG